MTTRFPGRGPQLARVLAGLLVVAVIGSIPAACTGSRAPAPLSATFESTDALAEAVLRALDDRDVDALRKLPITEAEFRQVVWPELPSSRPEVGLPWDYVWKDLRFKSNGALRMLLDDWQSAPRSLVRVEYRGASTAYASFTVHRKAAVIVRDAAGQEHALRLFGSILERDGRFKMFSYVVD